MLRHLLRDITLLVITLATLTATACQANDSDEQRLAKMPPSYADIGLNGLWPIIAHRGYWSDHDRPGNSLAALKAALQLNIYGSECDVRTTKDGVLVVCHDDTHDGLTISQCTYQELRAHPLANGEPLPRLEQFIQELKLTATKVRLVIEIKECDIDALLTLVEGYNVADRVLFIAFGMSYCNQLVKKGYGPQTFYLSGNLSPQEAAAAGYAGIDYSTAVYESHPEWIGQAADLGLRTIVWTPNDKKRIAGYIRQGVIVTTDRPLASL